MLGKVAYREGHYHGRTVQNAIERGAGELSCCAEAIAVNVQCRMNRLTAICGVFLACSATAHTRFPAEVERFIERREKCDHFRG